MRYLGNKKSNEFHDLTRQKTQCQVARIQAGANAAAFTPDTVAQAIREGFEPCAYCLGTFADLSFDASSPLPAAADLQGHAPGDGTVSLRWTYPDDFAAKSIRFDVYSSASSLEPFRSLRLPEHPTASALLSGFEAGGDTYFTVVARRGGMQSLPTAILHLQVPAVRPQVAVTPSTPAAGASSGLGFPFRVDGLGRVHAEGGDPRLRGKILQLLLTVPGERVNLPDYGTRVRDLVFDPNNDVLAAATEFTVTRALRRFLGEEIHVDKVQVSSGGHELSVDIVYLRKSDLSTERLRVGIPVLR
ncbi:GPW/gp25 family protein [Myxococcus stipitatus]|uniref:GPW/gp25 family protein n=1 Tax=Myxococcus stipitatus TaxID=83455 RepID=UPI001F3FFF11|nr:GPW/gp25 family protein [Myxococcus stipitatus]MCE9672837.1 GPW/gp25 family protein [Myxococcus stipitatus]